MQARVISPVPLPLNNGTQLAARAYRLDSAKIGQETIKIKRFLPLDPTGQAREVEGQRKRIQELLIPKTSYQKAYSTGDHFEVSEFFDERMEPAFFLYDYATGKNRPAAKVKSANLQAALKTEEQKFLELRQELLDEGWPEEKVNELYPEPEAGAEEEEREPEASKNAEENRARSLKRAKENARRIIQNERFDMMWTFTFSEKPGHEIFLNADARDLGISRYLPLGKQQDRAAVGKAWDNFQKRLKRHCKEKGIAYRWLKVLEIHDGKDTRHSKRGTYHIHLATDLRIKKQTMQQLWGFGIVHFTDFTKELYSSGKESKPVETSYSKDPSFYMAKYIDKDFDDARKHKQKAFSKSQNIKTPKPIRNGATIQEKKCDPLKAFQFKGMCREIREALKKSSMDDLQLSSEIYPIEYKKWNSDAREFQTVKGFVRKTYYSACLALPKYKARHERFLEKKRKAQEATRQLSLF